VCARAGVCARGNVARRHLLGSWPAVSLVDHDHGVFDCQNKKWEHLDTFFIYAPWISGINVCRISTQQCYTHTHTHTHTHTRTQFRTITRRVCFPARLRSAYGIGRLHASSSSRYSSASGFTFNTPAPAPSNPPEWCAVVGPCPACAVGNTDVGVTAAGTPRGGLEP
jgi:hypothetical protein